MTQQEREDRKEWYNNTYKRYILHGKMPEFESLTDLELIEYTDCLKFGFYVLGKLSERIFTPILEGLSIFLSKYPRFANILPHLVGLLLFAALVYDELKSK